MKKLTVTLLLLVSFFYSNAQDTQIENTESRNEVKINASNLIIFKWIDLGFERVINEESTYGANILFSLDNDRDTGLEEYRTFSFTPYYRHFFSRKYARGFFVEGFGMLHSGTDEFYVGNGNNDEYREENFTDFAIGMSAGAKFINKRGFVAEFYFGLGRDLLGNSDLEVVGRGGISLGYRF